MLFKISCCAFCFEGLDLDEKLKLVSNMAFDTVDLSAKQGGELSQQMMIEQPETYGAAIKKKAADHGLELDELFICSILDDGKDIDLTTDDVTTQEVISQWNQGNELEGWFLYWNQIYSYLAETRTDETEKYVQDIAKAKL